MITREGQLSVLALKSIDLTLLVIALAIAIVVGNSGQVESGLQSYSIDFFSTRIKLGNAILCSILLVIWNFSFRYNGVYRSYRLGTARDLTTKITKSLGYATVSLMAFAQISGWKSVGITPVLFFFVIAWMLILPARLTVFHLSRMFRNRGVNTKSLLILGGGYRGEAFIRQFRKRSELGYRVVGYLESDSGYRKSNLCGIPLLGTFEDLGRVVEEETVDEVVIALPIKSQYNRIRSAIRDMEIRGVVVHLLSDFFPHNLARIQPQNFDGLPLLSLHSTPLFNWRTELKRITDLCISLLLLGTLAPLLAFVAILIKIDSKGPVLFKQKRFGLNKREFWLYKFRTMSVDAEDRLREIEHLNEKDGPIFKIKKDPRITRVGRLLRKSSIDELPQLINVLIGDMSLVGPRPLSLRDGSRLAESWHKRRFSIRPGMTCLWQISGRSDLTFEEWMKLDLEYIDSWSLQLDWKILVRTIPAVVSARGAV
ncbi:MAG: sugar transferase [Acidobacteriota bacterium]|nr:sugar transferase [Acidobacteriota bacterium]